MLLLRPFLAYRGDHAYPLVSCLLLVLLLDFPLGATMLPKTQRYLERMYTDRRDDVRPQAPGRREVDKILAECHATRATAYAGLADSLQAMSVCFDCIDKLVSRVSP
jgi:hypothetical protein